MSDRARKGAQLMAEALCRPHLFVKPGGFVAAEHVHPHQEERFTVRSGILRLRIRGEERTYRAGNEATVPPGAYFAARVARDTAFFARLLAPEFVMVTAGDGRVWPRAEALGYLGRLDYDSVRTDSVRIALDGATAVATGLTLVWGRTRSGSPILGRSGAPPGLYRGTLVFSRRGSHWRLPASQGTLIY